MTESNAPLLKAEHLSVQFGGLTAVGDVTFDVTEGEIVSLIGPNGAGKTTMVNLLTGFTSPTVGSVRFAGADVTAWRPERIARAGLVRTFQNAAMFVSMSVADNLASGRFLRQQTGVWQTLLRTPAFRQEENEVRKRVDELIQRLGLRAHRDKMASDLPYGEQRVLGLGIALMAQPRLLVLDEPAAGLSPDETLEMGKLILQARDQGITIFLIEHNMSLVMSISDRVIVLKEGRKLAEGNPDSIRKLPEVIDAYLGAEV